MDEFTQKRMFGCSRGELFEMYEASIDFWDGEPHKLAISMLSDAQEVMSRGDTNRARQIINQVKWILSDKVPSKDPEVEARRQARNEPKA